mgnify:CR=1 FL=1
MQRYVIVCGRGGRMKDFLKQEKKEFIGLITSVVLLLWFWYIDSEIDTVFIIFIIIDLIIIMVDAIIMIKNRRKK